MSLYQKYRPHKFTDVLGQDAIITTLKNSILQNKINHAYIFSGPKGIGKTTIAKIFSKAVNCTSFTGDVCNQCEHCKLIDGMMTTEILELDAASNNGVDDVRNIIESVKFLPNTLTYKVYIIDEAHMLSNSAWNALLKTLEEPPKYVIFIFATTEIYKIPATIISRCQCFKFNRITDTQLFDLINKVAKNEDIKISKPAANTIVNIAHGSARDALSALEQAAMFTNNNINDETINELFGLVNNDVKISLIKNIINHNVSAVIDTIKTLGVKGIDFSQLSLDIANILLDKIIFNKTQKIELLNYLNLHQINSFQLDNNKLIQLINECQKCYGEIKNSEDPLFNFEVLCFSLMNILSNIENNIIFDYVDHGKLQKSEVSNPQTKEIKLIACSNDEEAVEFKEILVHKPEIKNKQVKQETTIKSSTNESEQNSSLDSAEELILKTIACSSKQTTKKAIELFEQIKLQEDEINYKNILIAKQVALASQNGIIFEFNDQLDADILNANCYDAKIQRKIIKLYNQPVYLLGCSTEQLKEYIKLVKLDKTKYKNEPDLLPLRNQLKSIDPLAQCAYELFKE